LFVGFSKTSSCPPVFQRGDLGGAPMYAFFDLYPTSDVRTATIQYGRNSPVGCADAESSPAARPTRRRARSSRAWSEP